MSERKPFDRNSPPDPKTDPLGHVLYLSWLTTQPPYPVEVPATDPNVKKVLETFLKADASDWFPPEPDPRAEAEFRNTLIQGWKPPQPEE